MQVFDILVYVTGELQELLHCLGWRLLWSFITLGLAAALNTKELVNGVGLDGAFSSIGLGLERKV